MGDQTQAYDIFQTPLSSGYPLPLSLEHKKSYCIFSLCYWKTMQVSVKRKCTGIHPSPPPPYPPQFDADTAGRQKLGVKHTKFETEANRDSCTAKLLDRKFGKNIPERKLRGLSPKISTFIYL